MTNFASEYFTKVIKMPLASSGGISFTGKAGIKIGRESNPEKGWTKLLFTLEADDHNEGEYHIEIAAGNTFLITGNIPTLSEIILMVNQNFTTINKIVKLEMEKRNIKMKEYDFLPEPGLLQVLTEGYDRYFN